MKKQIIVIVQIDCATGALNCGSKDLKRGAISPRSQVA